MKFGSVATGEAEGAILAHAVKQGGVVLKKGTVIGPAEIARLGAAGVANVVVARLESGDIGENEAAERLARAIAGAGLRVEAPFTGRSNLFAEVAGVLVIDAAAIDALNAVDETITAATLPAMKAVVAGEMVGTVKIIPFAVAEVLLARATPAAPAVSVAPFRARSVAVISTLLPGLKPSTVDKTLGVLAERLAPTGSTIAVERRVAHESAALAGALAASDIAAADLVIVFGASAITDRADVIPAAIERAGGRVDHLGMPVDPGNLLLVGEFSGRPVIGAPGCARSPKENGFDWVLQRLLADVPVTRADIQRMGVGGLLMEIVSRPQPRGEAAGEAIARAPRVETIVLAAGRSTRMGGPNKLLALHEGRPLVRHAAEHALSAGLGPVHVVTGHQGEAVEAALAGLDVTFVRNADYADGLSTSLKAGIAAVSPEAAGALVVLGDMPQVSDGVLKRLAAVFAENPEAKAVVPTFLGERGNPVLIARGLFGAVAQLSGDTGARRLIETAGAEVTEVAIDDAGIRLDIDTPEALAALTGRG